jgi:FkbM family methyltransferase
MAQPEPAPAIGIRTAGGVTVAVPGRIDLLTPYVLLEQEDWFEDEIGFLRKTLRAGMRVVDIGANYGLYTLSLAKVVGPSGRVWAVEPASGTADYLRQSVELNGFGQVTVIQKALSDREGTARLSIEANSELNSLSAGTSGATEEVPLTTLDALAAGQAWGAIDFLKLDAEGEEERIVAGGVVFLGTASPLVMFEIRHGERLNLQLVERLAAAGYGTYRLVPGLDLLVPWDPAAALDPFQLNLFACKPDRAALLESAGALEQGGGRHAQLQAEYARMQALCAGNGDADLLAECARLARALGERHAATGLLNRAIVLCQGAAGDARLLATLLADVVTLSAFSTYFVREPAQRDTTLRQLDALKATGLMRAPMERRRQLMRILGGLQAGPQPDSLLAARAPDHLNPELWGA